MKSIFIVILIAWGTVVSGAILSSEPSAPAPQITYSTTTR